MISGSYSLTLIIICYFIVNGVYIPAMPDVADYFHASSESVRASMTYFSLGALLSCIATGFISDFIGKKVYLFIGILIAITGSVLCLSADNLSIFLLGRFLQGTGTIIGYMIGFALAVDLYKPQETIKILAINTIVVALSSVFIPYIGGMMTRIWNWQSTFIFITILLSITFLNSISYLLKIKNVRKNIDFKSGLSEFWTLLTDRTYITYGGIHALFFIPVFFSITYLPFYFKHALNLEGHHIGIIIGSAIWLPFGLASILSVKLYARYGIENTIYIGLLTSFFSACFLCATTIIYPLNLLLNMAVMVVFFIGLGLFYSGSISLCMRIYPDLTTKASSLRTILISLFVFLGSWIAQHSSDKIFFSLAVAYIIPSTLSLILFISWRKKKQ